ncbi:MAG TPA: Rpn family recombination-promoting nuclease/putative transposase [Thermoanaerobaculia bacterium]|nr:Rpn family recombination-promoting nuclease/putative transposase [Thermoanaerobaculia bacterium]
MATQHDKIFKQLLHAYLDDFLRIVVPDVLDRLDLSSPEFLDKELFAGGPHGRRRELDLLVRVRTVKGRPLLIHVEIEARANPGMEERLWRYRNQIQARYDTAVLTIVVYLKRGHPGVGLKTRESDLGPNFPELRYISFGLAGCQAEHYLARAEPLAWALAALMDPGQLSRAELKMACLRRIAGLRRRADPFLLVNCVENYLELMGGEAVELEALRTRKENREVQAMAMTWSEKLEAKGVREILLLLLAERFGPLPEGARLQVEKISSLRRLTQLAKRVLTAHSLEEMGLA